MSDAPSYSGNPTGSPNAAESTFVAVGRVHRPHGVKGEVIVEVLTDFPERLRSKACVYGGSQYQPLTIRSLRPYKTGFLVSFEGIDTIEQAGSLRQQILYVPTDESPPLPEGEYYHHQLLGLDVVDENEQALGTLTEILETGANDVYVVRRDSGREVLLPAIADVILDVDLSLRKMRVHLLPGLDE